MISPRAEKKLLQIVVSVACLVPVLAGLHGMLAGAGQTGRTDLDSHFRYLSGLLLGVGIGFLSTIAHIERHAARFRLLTLIVVTGGMGRLIGLFTVGFPGFPMLGALGMELMVTPLLCLWQSRISRNALQSPPIL